MALSCVILSCNSNQTDKESLLAEAFGKKLYLKDIYKSLPNDLSKEDSVNHIINAKNIWIEKQVLLNKAAFNLTAKQTDDIKSKVEEYEHSLLIYAYEKELVKTRIDTVVTNDEITDYFETNKEKFILKSPLIKCLFFKIEKVNTALKEYTTHISFENEKDSTFIESQQTLNVNNINITNPNKWMLADKVLALLPNKENSNSNSFIKKNKIYKTQDENNIYLLNILEYKTENQIAPLEYVKNDIILMLRNHKKKATISSIRKELIELAISENDVTIYEK